MSVQVITRWEELREVVDGPKRHRESVRQWLLTRPALLYWGDSWFSTPLYPNLARQSSARINGLRMVVGKPGATAAELLTPGGIGRIADRIAGNPFDLMCVSAGGNDALSERLAKVFARWMQGKEPRLGPAAAFDVLVDSGLFDRLRERYDLLLSTLDRKLHKKRPHFRVVGQSYAPLCRIGEGGDLTISNIGLIAALKHDVGPWLYGPMAKVLSSKAEGAAFSNLLLVDGFRDRVLAPMKAKHAGFFDFANIAGVAELAQPGLWYDEIHPTEAGFALCAPVLNAAIRSSLPPEKQGAVG